MTFTSQRRAFEKGCLKALATRIKGSRWKKNQNAIFCKLDGYYFDVIVSVFLNDFKTSARMSAKPMSLDPLYWKITGLSDNNSEPLSFRTWGAFTCSGLPLVKTSMSDEHVSADLVANRVVEWASSQLEAALQILKAEKFSSLIAKNPNQVERGAYAISYITTLIDEGNLDIARKMAAAYANRSAQSVSRHTHGGRDFHEIAAEWIDSTKGISEEGLDIIQT